MAIETSGGRERRTETRTAAEGHVTLWLNGSALAVFPAHLIDIAKSGFRAQHRSPALHPGLVVEFETAAARGRAKVIWTRIMGETVESGFLILAENAA